MTPCKLCLGSPCRPAGQAAGRTLVHCPHCELVFVAQQHWLSSDDERRRYALHDNSPTSAGYRRFLGQVADFVDGLAPRPGRILDFGSGERAVLAGMLVERGHVCAAYDPLYGLGRDALAQQHDLVILCEVIEHLRDLRAELQTVRHGLAPSGRVLVRTQVYPSIDEIPVWWYSRDPTHINFLAAHTFDAMLPLLGLGRVERLAADLFLLA